MYIKQMKLSFTILTILFLFSCASLIGPFSPIAYQNATSLKAETLSLLDKADTPYKDNQSQVESVQLKAEKAYEFVKGVPKNQLSTKQWAILKDPDGDLLGKFLKRWKERSTLSKVIIKEYKLLTAAAFDEIICLEANKKQTTECLSGGKE